MTDTEAVRDHAEGWPLGSPWRWLLAGLLISLAAYLWVNLYEEQATWFRLLLIVAGVMCTAGAVVIRMNTSRPASLDELRPATRSLVLSGLFLIFGAMTLFPLALLLGGLLQGGEGWNIEGVILLNLIVVPVAGYLSHICLKCCKTGQSLGQTRETAAVLALGALSVFLCCWALFLGEARADSWDTMRLVLSVLAAVAMLGAGIVLLPSSPRRVIISVLILLHFGGILTAVMSAPPQPWIFRQIWARIYRPYLQFMFLNNAYHFYAPEPGPASFLWFHIEYQNDNDPDDRLYRWVDFPKIRADGTPDYFYSVLYQRRLALTDHVQYYETTPPPLLMWNEQGKPVTNPVYYWRKIYSDQPSGEVLGQVLPPDISEWQKIPFHPMVPFTDQYRIPTQYAKKMCESFAWHVYREPHPTQPQYKPVSVRVYRVVHVIPSFEMIAAHISPTSPILYRPYYMGMFGREKEDGPFKLLDAPEYDPHGNLISGDPLLYWLIPILPDNNFDPATLNQSIIRGYVYRHAGDRNWKWYPGEAVPRE